MKRQNPRQNLCVGLLPIIVLALIFVSAARADYKSTILADHPVGYWPLDLSVDTNGAATDLSGSGNNGTYVNISSSNEVAGPSAFIPNGVSFDGSTTYVDLSTGPNPSVLNFTGQITMEVWVQPASSQKAGTYADIFAKGWDSVNYSELELSVVNSDLFRSGRQSGVYVSYGTVTTNWTHLVCTWDGTNWNLYVNGQSVGMDADSAGASQFNDPWAIGNGTEGGAAYGGRIFTGNICQVALYNYALTPAQIATHYAQAHALPSLNVAPSGGHLLISWPLSAVNFVLEQNSDLTATNWLTNGLTVSVVGTNETVSIIPAAGSAFYRLLSISPPAPTSFKKGIAAYNLAQIQDAPLAGAVWAYDWQADFPSLPAGIEYVPMKWGYYPDSGDNLSSLTNWVAGLKNAGAKEVLAFNEPDNAGQSDLTVAQALQGYGYLYQGRLPVISPGCGNDESSWMQLFMSGAASQGDDVPAVAVHWYGTSASAFLSYIDSVYNSYSKPLWITEFAPTATDWANPDNFEGMGVDDCVAFINTVLPGLESRSYVARYSWYVNPSGPSYNQLGTSALFNSDNTLSEVGDRYKNPGGAFTPAGYTWRLVNRTSTNCLDNYGETTNGSGVFQRSAVTSTNQNQRWTITASGSHYKLQCVTGGLYLDTLGHTASGSLVGQETSSNSSNQLWNIISVGSGCFTISSVASGLCLDSLGYTNNGSAVGQWSNIGTANQQWMLIGY